MHGDFVNHKENIIEVEHVSFSYGERNVLRDISLDIHRGDYLGIVGNNGSGKTTLLKVMLGLLAPATGSVKLFGTPIAQFKDWHNIGYVPQKVSNFDTNFPATVEEIAEMGRYGLRGIFRNLQKVDHEKVRSALEYVDMWQHRKRIIGTLSGGQQQRVFIARALAMEPKVLFLDEPTVGIEKEIRDEFYSLLQKLNTELQLTVVLITHDIESIAHEAMHVACIDKTLTYHDSIETYFHSTHLARHTAPNP